MLLKLDDTCLNIAAFGSAREEPKVCVKIGMELKGHSPSLLVVPMICEPFNRSAHIELY